MGMLLVVAGRRNLLDHLQLLLLGWCWCWCWPLTPSPPPERGSPWSLIFSIYILQPKFSQFFVAHYAEIFTCKRLLARPLLQYAGQEANTLHNIICIIHFQYGCVLTMTSRRTVQREMIWGVHSVRKCFFCYRALEYLNDMQYALAAK